MHDIKIAPAFKRQLKKKPPDAKKRVANAVTQLRVDPTHNSLRTHPVKKKAGVFEARLDKGGRLTFHWDGSTIVLRANCSHDAVLRRP